MSPTASTATRRLWWATLAVIVLVGVTVSTVGMVTINRQSDQIGALQAESDTHRQGAERRQHQIAELELALEADRAVLHQLGIDPPSDQVAISATPQVIAVPGRDGRRGPGPTDDQVRVAVAAHLTAHPPTPGRAPTDDEIDAAAADYLAANPPAPGATGPPPSTATVAAEVARWLEANPPAQGPQGIPGQSPPCLSQPSQCQGPAGRDGIDGATGQTGAPGAAGQPPVSWESTDPDGRTTICTRTEPFDPAQPRYQCAVVAPPPTTTTTTVPQDPDGR